jgi:NADH dehydrogenase
MILIVGATGRLGSKIAHALLVKSRRVRVLARPASTFQPLADAGAEVVFGDLKDRASLDAACRGIETVVSTANSVRRGGDDNVNTVDLLGTTALIDAAQAAGVQRFIYVSVLGARADHPAPFLAAKGKNEEHLRARGMAWTILAPNMFIESWPAMVVGAPAIAGNPITLVGEGRKRHTFVAESNVADFAVAAVDNPAARNQHVPIGGPDALTWRDVVQVYEGVLGRPLEVRFVKPGEPVPGIPPAVQPLLAAQDTYESVFDTEAPARTYGVTLISLETIARAHADGIAH